MDRICYISNAGIFEYEFSAGELLARTLSGQRNAHTNFATWLVNNDHILNVIKSPIHVEMILIVNGIGSTTRLVVSGWVDPQWYSYCFKICDGEKTYNIDVDK